MREQTNKEYLDGSGSELYPDGGFRFEVEFVAREAREQVRFTYP